MYKKIFNTFFAAHPIVYFQKVISSQKAAYTSQRIDAFAIPKAVGHNVKSPVYYSLIYNI